VWSQLLRLVVSRWCALPHAESRRRFGRIIACWLGWGEAPLVYCNRSSLMNSRASGVPLGSREAAEDLSPGREPWVRRSSPRLWHPSPARAGEGKGEREGCLNPRLNAVG
jgi:hypothetical protein